jgi:hypothetical protein
MGYHSTGYMHVGPMRWLSCQAPSEASAAEAMNWGKRGFASRMDLSGSYTSSMSYLSIYLPLRVIICVLFA